MFSISNKKIIVTGGSGFLGKEIVCKIIENNGIPIVLDINQTTNLKFKKFVKNKYNKNLDIYNVDITKENQIKKIHSLIKKKYITLDALINNADSNPKIDKTKNSWSNLGNTNLLDFKSALDISLSGSFLMIKYFGKLISINKIGGTIINISSDLGVIAPDHRLYNENIIKKFKPLSYSVSKHGLIGLTKYISTYLEYKNVRSNAICSSGIFNDVKKADPKFIRKLKKTIPLNRLASSNDVCSTIIWLLSDSASFINGSVIMVDGGRSAW